MSSTQERVALCNVDDVPEGSAVKVDVDDLELAVFNTQGRIFVTDDQCTHGAASLSEGFVEGCRVICDLHEGAFDLETGEAVAPPCILPIKTYRAIVEDGVVFIDLPSS